MISSLILVKIIVTMVVVVGLSLVAERVGIRQAGVLAGFPHGIAIVLFFIGLEQGAEFATNAALFATAGLGANVLLAYIYAQLSMRLSAGLAAVVLTGLASVSAFLAAAFILHLISPGPALAVGLTLSMIILVRFLLRKTISNDIAEKPRLRILELLLRAAIAAVIVVLITSAAAAIGPGWAGLLAGFPVVTFPLLLIIHARHGPVPVAAMVRHYPFGLVSLLVFTLSVSWGFATLGVGLGTLVGLLAALFYLALASGAKEWMPR